MEIDTTAPGLKIGEHLPKLAKHGKELAVVRSMSTKEGDHNRATYLLRTGYTPLGAIQYPAAGAVIAKELGSESADLPNFVSVAPARYSVNLGGRFLGPRFDPLVVGDLVAPQDGLKVPDLDRTAGVSDDAQRARLELLAGAEQRFAGGRDSAVASSIQAATTRAVRLMKPEAAAFDLDREKPNVRSAYAPWAVRAGVLARPPAGRTRGAVRGGYARRVGHAP